MAIWAKSLVKSWRTETQILSSTAPLSPAHQSTYFTESPLNLQPHKGQDDAKCQSSQRFPASLLINFVLQAGHRGGRYSMLTRRRDSSFQRNRVVGSEESFIDKACQVVSECMSQNNEG